MPAPNPRSVADVLTKARLAAVGRTLGAAVPASGTKEAQAAALTAGIGLDALLGALGRDELRAACRAHGLDDSGRSRLALMARLLAASGDDPGAAPSPAFAAAPSRRLSPTPGDIVSVRHRQHLVEDVILPPALEEATRAVLAGLDDDNQGRRAPTTRRLATAT